MPAKTATILLSFVLAFVSARAVSADTLIVIFDRENFVRGDSIGIEIYTEPYRSSPPAQTLHLWIDNIKTGQRWKYRYPFLKGRCKISLQVSNSIPAGIYAFNFLLQDRFFAIQGKVLNASKQDTMVNYLARAKGKIPSIDGAPLQPGGYFRIENLFFTDSVIFSFSPVQPQKDNPLHIKISTPLDSVFEPQSLTTEFISIGRQGAGIPAAAKESYRFDSSDKRMLQEVVVKTKAKKAIDEYIEKNVRGLFAGNDAKTLDFLGSDEAMSYPDLFTYLCYKFPVLTQKTDAETGLPYLVYRNQAVEIYVDEILDTDFTLSRISMQEIAMVKFFQQSFRLGGGINDNGLGGSVAIYTKQPGDKKGNKLGNYTFLIKGYSPVNSEWK